MARDGFKLHGNTEAKFKQLEQVLPRIMSHMSTKTYGIIPASILSTYKERVNSEEDIFKGILFEGKVKKVLFKIEMLEGNSKPAYTVLLKSSSGQQSFEVETKKLFHFVELNIPVADGDVLCIRQINPDIVLYNVYLSALIELKQDYNEVKEFVTEQLLESIENERI